MKLSNKILIGFFGFIFLYLTAVFAEVRLRGIPNIINDSNSIGETVDISGVAYLVLDDLDKDINVIGSDTPRLEVRSLSGDLLKRVKYKISGDTLTLSNLKSLKKETANIYVFVPDLRGMIVNDAVANVKGFDLELLHISQNAGRTSMSDNRIGNLHIQASRRSYLNISATHLDTLSAEIEESEVLIFSPMNLLKGSMINHSFLRVNHIDEIQFKKDETSRLNSYQ